jgi:glycosyltransferase involved in cell wall biosynthesis
MMYSLDAQREENRLNSRSVPKSPVRVLYYISYYQRMAGANRVLFELIKHLPDTVTPLVVVAGEGRAAEAYRNAGIEVEVMPPGSSLNQFGKAMLRWSPVQQGWVTLNELFPYTLQCMSLIRSWQPDIVHVDGARGTLLIGTAARMLRRPVVGHMHGEFPFGGISQTIFERVSDRIITVCSSIQSSLSPTGRAKAVTVYNGIQEISDRGQPLPWLEALKAQGKLIVACFASVVPFKGHHHLLNAVAELNRRGWGDRAVFLCVGDMPQEYQEHANWLKQRQQKLGIENVIFTGWQSNPFPFYRAADIEVLPSVRSEQLDYGDRVIQVQGNEGFPTTHLEAMYFGLPVVGTAIAGVQEQIETGVNGFVVPPADPIALADVLEKLLLNPELRQQMGRAGRDRVQRCFSTDAYVSGVLDVYQSLLSYPVNHQPSANQALPV